MRCQEVRPLIYTYLDGYLEGKIERSFFGHLSQCQACQQELDYARQTHALLERFCIPVEPPANFVEEVMAALDCTTNQQLAAEVSEVKQNSGQNSKKKQDFSWNFRRLAQVASFVLLSATVWLASLLNGGFQLARTPEPNIGPKTGYEVPKEAKEQSLKQVFEVAMEPNNAADQEPALPNDHPAEPVTPEGSLDAEQAVKVEPSQDKNLSDPGKGKQEPGFEGIVPEPGDITQGNQLPSLPDPIPAPQIVEPGGTFKAAGMTGGEALKSVSLQRVALGETKGNSGIFADGQVKYLAGTIGKPLEVWVSGNKGTEPSLLGKTEKAVDGKAIWSPDGKKLAYLHQENNRLSFYADDLSGKAWEIAPAEGQGSIKYPAWSSQEAIAYLLVGESANQIVVARGQSSTVIGSTDLDCTPAWSPDGAWIAYGKNGYLYITSSDGTKEKVLGELAGQLQKINWSPDGQTLAVSIKGTKNQQGIWIGSLDQSGWKRLVEIGGGRELNWSPDARKIAFTDTQGIAYLLTLTKEKEKDKLYPITPEAGNNGAAGLAWFPDSKALLVEWAPAGETQGIWKAALP